MAEDHEERECPGSPDRPVRNARVTPVAIASAGIRQVERVANRSDRIGQSEPFENKTAWPDSQLLQPRCLTPDTYKPASAPFGRSPYETVDGPRGWLLRHRRRLRSRRRAGVVPLDAVEPAERARSLGPARVRRDRLLRRRRSRRRL